jgi:hypothetical protein
MSKRRWEEGMGKIEFVPLSVLLNRVDWRFFFLHTVQISYLLDFHNQVENG